METKTGQAPFLEELSSLEVESLYIVEDAARSEQASCLDRIRAPLGWLNGHVLCGAYSLSGSYQDPGEMRKADDYPSGEYIVY